MKTPTIFIVKIMNQKRTPPMIITEPCGCQFLKNKYGKNPICLCNRHEIEANEAEIWKLTERNKELKK